MAKGRRERLSEDDAQILRLESPVIKGHTGKVWDVCWSPDGRRLASASEDGTVKVWDAQSGEEGLTLPGHADKVTAAGS